MNKEKYKKHKKKILSDVRSAYVFAFPRTSKITFDLVERIKDKVKKKKIYKKAIYKKARFLSIKPNLIKPPTTMSRMDRLKTGLIKAETDLKSKPLNNFVTPRIKPRII